MLMLCSNLMIQHSTWNQLICSNNNSNKLYDIIVIIICFISFNIPSDFDPNIIRTLLRSFLNKTKNIIWYENDVSTHTTYAPSTNDWLSMHRCLVSRTLNTDEAKNKNKMISLFWWTRCFMYSSHFFIVPFFFSSLRFSLHFLKGKEKRLRWLMNWCETIETKRNEWRRRTGRSEELTTKQMNGWKQCMRQAIVLCWQSTYNKYHSNNSRNKKKKKKKMKPDFTMHSHKCFFNQSLRHRHYFNTRTTSNK